MTQTRKIALITGGSRGLGKNMALSIAKRGTDVLFTYNSKKDEADAVVKQLEAAGIKAAALQLNVADIKSFDNFFMQVRSTLQSVFGADKITYLVNNAGVGFHEPFATTTEEQFDNMLNIHFKAVFFLSQKALPLLEDGGGIVNVSTGLARFCIPGSSTYAAMKGAVEVLSRYMAKELGARGIRVNVIAPGAIATDFSGGLVRDNPEVNAGIAAQTALGRVGRPDDIGSVVAFLCSDDAKWVNAQRLEASGGMFL
ncbi:SDR family NAD(P)-dependent oxidoreductase [Deminuibacter soli]|uniref:SDR family NAD(P)-dependent oxidoreductase n=1 Tax=Deminuibacter soli TaxID=2291815 RepID=A0A3E1NE93_9BACT|nr:SDR family oxidoreductase [Deminuibacter soli]RFM26295.1 SDR family NAD(P)-dependent oxidoreductase [Deminuibacter soli]